nr:hypothetical protein B0A51_04737 [Rachicladosporium sp. CCFEE 5018]
MKRTAPLPTTLDLTPTPFRSSRLAVPPSPFSPLSPLSPHKPSFPPSLSFHFKPTSLILPPPPPQPLKWLWQCHLCSRIYALGTTRRCLDDGHYFCAGTPVWKRDRKTGKRSCKKGRACASEFDYAGWKARGEWRRDVAGQVRLAKMLRGEQIVSEVASSPTKKDCWANCDYPSECRWGKQFRVAQGRTQDIGVAVMTPTAVGEPPPPSKSFDDVLGNSTAAPDLQNITLPDAPPVPERKPSLDDVVSSAQRRKRRSLGAPPSPVASHPPAPEHEPGPLIAHAVNPPSREADGDITDEPTEHDTSAHALQKAFDEFELDVRKGLGKAGEIWSGFLTGSKRKGSR